MRCSICFDFSSYTALCTQDWQTPVQKAPLYKWETAKSLNQGNALIEQMFSKSADTYFMRIKHKMNTDVVFCRSSFALEKRSDTTSNCLTALQFCRIIGTGACYAMYANFLYYIFLLQPFYVIYSMGVKEFCNILVGMLCQQDNQIFKGWITKGLCLYINLKGLELIYFQKHWKEMKGGWQSILDINMRQASARKPKMEQHMLPHCLEVRLCFLSQGKESLIAQFNIQRARDTH